ncbi:MAG: geranylgeranylglycerol-phosphate geranylgeranyltransferase [Bacteroidota bacterium]
MKYLKLIRYQNLLLLAFMQLVFRYGFLKQQDIWLSLSDWQYGLLVLTTVLLAAGGYVINDIFDQDTDNDNKPSKVIIGRSISEGNAYYIYAGLTLSGVSIGMYLSNVIQKPGFVAIFIFIAALLYFYATTLKQMVLLGNIAVASLLGFSVLIIGFFDLYPAAYEGNVVKMKMLLSILKDYAIYAFIINFIREMVKDLEDVNGDYNQGMKTLPIVLGISRTSKVVFGLLLLSILMLLYYLTKNVIENNLYYAAVYVLIFVIAPLIFCAVQMWSANNKKQFHLVSLILKWVIFFGILSITAITYNIIHNVTK